MKSYRSSFAVLLRFIWEEVYFTNHLSSVQFMSVVLYNMPSFWASSI